MSHNFLAEQPEGQAPRFLLRGTDRAIAQLQRQAALGMARIAQVAAEQTLRVETVACVTRAGLTETALLTQTEQCLGTLVPLAVSRLQGLADIGVLAIAQIISDTGRRLSP